LVLAVLLAGANAIQPSRAAPAPETPRVTEAKPAKAEKQQGAATGETGPTKKGVNGITKINGGTRRPPHKPIAPNPCDSRCQHDQAELSAINRTAEYTGDLVVAAWVNAVLIILQSGVLFLTVRVATRQTRDAKDAFDKTERPYLFISNITWPPEARHRAGGLEPGLIYVVLNGGKLPAIVEEVEFVISEDGEIDHPKAVPIDHPLLVSGIIGAEEKFSVPETLDESLTTHGTESFLMPDRTTVRVPGQILMGQLFVRVVIRYRGPFSHGHESGAAWEWIPMTNFVRFGGVQYNYTK